MTKGKSQQFSISISTILRVGAVILLVFLFFKIWKLMAGLFLGIVLAAAIEPTIALLERKKIPRKITVPALYLLSISSLFGVFYVFMPTLFNEVWVISQTLPDKYRIFVETLFDRPGLQDLGFLAPSIDNLLVSIQDKIAEFIPNIFGFISTIFGGVASFLLIIVFSFYISLNKKQLEKGVVALLPEKYRESGKKITRAIERRVGRWLQAMFVLATFIGIAVFVILSFLDVKFALTLGIAAGLLEIVPYIGPFIAGTLIFLTASLDSVGLGLIALGAYILLQQLEQIFVVPAVMSRVVGFNPLYIIMFILIGAELAGLWGVIIAVPLAAAISELIRGLNTEREKHNSP